MLRRSCGTDAVDFDARAAARSPLMRDIVIGAGRGQRLMPTTADAPKCFTRIGDRRLKKIAAWKQTQRVFGFDGLL